MAIGARKPTPYRNDQELNQSSQGIMEIEPSTLRWTSLIGQQEGLATECVSRHRKVVHSQRYAANWMHPQLLISGCLTAESMKDSKKLK